MNIYRGRRGFTLIELLTVIAIIGILAAIVIPAVGMVKVTANNARTKAQFSQWGAAMALFKQEYRYYPQINDSENKIDSAAFFGALTGKTADGDPLDVNTYGNTKKLSFYDASDADVSSLGDGDAVDGLVKDAFGNTDIVVFRDTDGNGIINNMDNPGLAVLGVVPAGQPVDSVRTPMDEAFNVTDGVRAGVLFYSAGRGESDTDIVYSWK